MATQKGRNWSSGDIVTAANLSSIERGVSAMAEEYTPTTWANGDIVTVETLNNIEQGIVSGINSAGADSTAIEYFIIGNGSFSSDPPADFYNPDHSYILDSNFEWVNPSDVFNADSGLLIGKTVMLCRYTSNNGIEVVGLGLDCGVPNVSSGRPYFYVDMGRVEIGELGIWKSADVSWYDGISFNQSFNPEAVL